MPHPRLPVLGLLFAALAQSAVAQAVLHVGPGNHPTIQSAINAAAPGDIIEVAAGVYPSFDVGKPLTITNEPSALVQVVTAGSVTFTLLPQDRVVLGGLDIQAQSVTIGGGVVSAERCTLQTNLGLQVSNATVTLRWCASGAYAASGVLLQDAHLHASDSTFSTAAGGSSEIEHGAVTVKGDSACSLSLCTLVGAWPALPGMPWPSAALHVTDALGLQRTWLVDCTLRGGFLFTGLQGPSIAAPALPAQPPVRVHRCQFFGPVFGAVATGPILGVHTPIDMVVGGTFVTTVHAEPGHPLLFYTGSDGLGPVQIFELEQPAFLFVDTLLFDLVTADAQGMASLPFAVPNVPGLRHVTLWWRCLDLGVFPMQGTPPFITIVQ